MNLEDMNKLMSQFENLADGKLAKTDNGKYEVAPDIGFAQLDQMWDELEEIKNGTNELAANYILGINRVDGGRIASKDTVSIDTREIRRLLDNVDDLTDNTYDAQAAILAESKRKHDLYMEKGKRRNSLLVFVTQNEKSIEQLRKSISDLKIKAL